MSGIDLYLDFNGERVRISSARLRTQADADELINAISIVRKLLPEGAGEKAVAVPPEGGSASGSPSSNPVANVGEEANGTDAVVSDDPASREDADVDRQHRATSGSTGDAREAPASLARHSTAPALTPAKPTGPQAKHVAEEPSVSNGSGGMQDGVPVHPATPSPARAKRSDEGRTTGKTARAKAFVAPAGEQQERTAKRAEVAALHEAEPWLTPDEAAQRLFIPVVNLRIFTVELEIEWSQKRKAAPAPAAKDKSPSLLSRVRKMHEQHPQWPAHIIANRLGGSVPTIKRYLTAIREESRDTGSAAEQGSVA